MKMQNINVLYFLSPIIMIALSVGLIAYWKIKKRFTVWTLLLALVAYAGAIALKVVFQYFTAQLFYDVVGGNLAALGIYFGLQTVIFEVGGAFLAAKIAFSRGRIRADDAEGYGLGLAFWENGVLIGGSALLNGIVWYVTLAGGGLAAEQLFEYLSTASPILFDSSSVILPQIGLAVIERVGSLFVHFSWGLLCVFAVVFKKKRFLWLALPMGLVDFLVPYAGVIGALNFEIIFFSTSLLCLLVTIWFTRAERKNVALTSSLPVIEEGVNRLKSLVRTNFKRAISFGSVYLILGIAMSMLMGGISIVISSAAAEVNEMQVFTSQFFPIMLPLTTVIGALGGLMVFVSDRTKGVYEYLIAYGVNVYEIFWSTLLVSFGLVSVVLGVSIVGNLGLSLIVGAPIEFAMIEMMLIYTIPISYASVAFMCMAGMIWSSLTVRVPGVNSPVGISTILGIGPSMIVMLVGGFLVGSGDFMLLVGGVDIILVGLVATMMIAANKKMNRERLLSDA
ncbi:MAG: YhfC family intramembrane metalloprotease [Candidatus Bathyarchaeota archaeon]|nr:YhfC family intramembrane metalloprotease [Candidatus Termiticorpusculum sp.]